MPGRQILIKFSASGQKGTELNPQSKECNKDKGIVIKIRTIYQNLKASKSITIKNIQVDSFNAPLETQTNRLLSYAKQKLVNSFGMSSLQMSE